MNISGLHIRRFESSDQSAVRELILEGLAEHFGQLDPSLNPDLLDIQGSYIRRGHLIIVALLGGQIVGSGGLVGETSATGRIVRLSVASKFRRSGIGHAIVRYLIAEAQKMGLTRLVIETNKDWMPAIKLYEKFGFREYRRDQGCIHFTLGLSSSFTVDQGDERLPG